MCSDFQIIVDNCLYIAQDQYGQSEPYATLEDAVVFSDIKSPENGCVIYKLQGDEDYLEEITKRAIDQIICSLGKSLLTTCELDIVHAEDNPFSMVGSENKDLLVKAISSWANNCVDLCETPIAPYLQRPIIDRIHLSEHDVRHLCNLY